MSVGPMSWRSILFVPAHVDRYVAAAGRSGADAIQLDLEDSVPAARKPDARRALESAVGALTAGGRDVLVRINRDLRNTVADLEAAVVGGVAAISVPKTCGAAHLVLIDELITDLEIERSLPAGGIGLIAMVETVDGLDRVESLPSASPRVVGVTLGSEDFSADAAMEPTAENLFNPCQRIVFAARSGGVQAYGFPGSIAEYGDLSRYREQTARGRSMGFDGALCIHPSQVAVLNAVFSPGRAELEQAREVIAAYDAALAENRGAATLHGRMIDLPVVRRARALLERGDRVGAPGD